MLVCKAHFEGFSDSLGGTTACAFGAWALPAGYAVRLAVLDPQACDMDNYVCIRSLGCVRVPCGCRAGVVPVSRTKYLIGLANVYS